MSASDGNGMSASRGNGILASPGSGILAFDGRGISASDGRGMSAFDGKGISALLIIFISVFTTENKILTLLLLNTSCLVLANSVDPDQLASEEANWSGSALFVIKYVNFYQKPGSSNLIGWKLQVGVASYSAWEGLMWATTCKYGASCTCYLSKKLGTDLTGQ